MEFNTNAGKTKTTYSEEKGDFVERPVAEVQVEEASQINEVAKVVDLLNEHDADEIRSAVDAPETPYAGGNE